MEEIRQNGNETENSYASRIGYAAYPFGNVHKDNEKIRIFTKGLLPSVRPIVELLRSEKQHYGITFNLIVAFAGDEGDSKCASESKTGVRSVFPTNTPAFARAHANHAIPTTRTSSPLTKRVVCFMEPINPSTSSDVYYVDDKAEKVEV